VTDPAGHAGERGEGAASASEAPTEEELRAAYEAELSRITSADMMLQAAVSLLNIGGRRLGGDRPAAGSSGTGPAGATGRGGAAAGTGRDLEQVRDAIDGVRALLGILERRMPRELSPLRDALSQLQMAFAREVQATAADARPGGGDAAPGAPGPERREPQGKPGGDPGARREPEGTADDQGSGGPGPAESSGRLWVPGR